MYVVRYLPSLFVILLGSMDCLTTVVGTLFFGTQELNPLIAQLVHTNLPLFVGVKLAATISVGIIFILAEKMLSQTNMAKDNSYRTAHKILRSAYVVISAFLGLVVVNNILVLLHLV